MLEGGSFSCAHQFLGAWLLKDKSELDFTVPLSEGKMTFPDWKSNPGRGGESAKS